MGQHRDFVKIESLGSGQYRLKAATIVDASVETVFRFFSDPGNLERLTPPFLKFRILTPDPIDMKQGAIIDYRLHVHGIPIRWQSEITLWEQGVRFTDEQRRGPYHAWRHDHFFDVCSKGTRVIDQVQYRPRGGRLIHRIFVRRDLERIFAFRRDALHSVLDRHAQAGSVTASERAPDRPVPAR